MDVLFGQSLSHIQRIKFCTEQRKLLSQLDNLKINALNKYLSTKYANTEKSGYTCEFCNIFTAPTKKSLSAHVRACKKNHDIKVDTATLCVEINSNSS